MLSTQFSNDSDEVEKAPFDANGSFVHETIKSIADYRIISSNYVLEILFASSLAFCFSTQMFFLVSIYNETPKTVSRYIEKPDTRSLIEWKG